MNISTNLLMIYVQVLAAVIGYWLGSVKFFREHQLKMYGEVLPPLVKFTFNPWGDGDEKEFNAALLKIWLYASKDVARKLDRVISCMLNSERGNYVTEWQKVIVAMRRDVQPCWRWRQRKMNKDEVQHFYASAVAIIQKRSPGSQR